jgi:hypothetical protein
MQENPRVMQALADEACAAPGDFIQPSNQGETP